MEPLPTIQAKARRIPCRPGVYRIVNSINGKCYIGSTVNMSDRITTHKIWLRKGCHHSVKLQRAWAKYGPAVFVFSPLIECSRDNLVFYEQRAINAFDAVKRGYNVAATAGMPLLGVSPSAETRAKLRAKAIFRDISGAIAASAKARLGTHRTDETKAKISATLTGRKASPAAIEKMRGRKTSDATKEKIRCALMGHAVSAETRAKLSANSLGKPGKPHSMETRARLSAGAKGRKPSQSAIDARKAYVFSEEERARISASLIEFNAKRHASQSADICNV